MNLQDIFESLRESSKKLAQLSPGQKNKALLAVKDSLAARTASIIAANDHDVMRAKDKGMKDSLIDRLRLDEARMEGILSGIDEIIAQTDPVGQVVSGWTNENGLVIKQVRVPIGVAAIIYESRPNVTVDAFAIAYKSGNAILLRGSSTALETNMEIVAAIKAGLRSVSDCGAGVPGAVELAASGSRDEVEDILNARGYIDVVLPRGGANLIKMVVEKASVPVIETGSGICHLFVDESADLDRAAVIAENAKLQRPGVCNAIEVLLVHSAVAQEFLPKLSEKFAGRAQFRCDERALPIMQKAAASGVGAASGSLAEKVVAAGENDFDTEFLDNILAIKVVDSVEEAVAHINAHNTKHSESILTSSIKNASYFKTNVDAACVYVNASTRFTDGQVFGYGAELGISTQKLHVRGPMGLAALTTTKYLIEGEGQIR
ncbi:MAG: glutamate-5-semialdehyde dehydrogenase [Treponemataceae bacterium]|nr:glutamate-5-semialdehyde dehydrogenase [Treponemataceae bacterium]